MFVSTFHSTRETFISQGQDYKSPSFDAFCDYLIREQEKLLYLGFLNLGNSFKKALVPQQQPNSKNPKKQYQDKMVLNQTRVLSNFSLKMKNNYK